MLWRTLPASVLIRLFLTSLLSFIRSFNQLLPEHLSCQEPRTQHQNQRRDPASVPQRGRLSVRGGGGGWKRGSYNSVLQMLGWGTPQEGSVGMQGAGECLGGGGVHTETSTKQNPAAEDCGEP